MKTHYLVLLPTPQLDQAARFWKRGGWCVTVTHATRDFCRVHLDLRRPLLPHNPDPCQWPQLTVLE